MTCKFQSHGIIFYVDLPCWLSLLFSIFMLVICEVTQKMLYFGDSFHLYQEIWQKDVKQLVICIQFVMCGCKCATLRFFFLIFILDFDTFIFSQVLVERAFMGKIFQVRALYLSFSIPNLILSPKLWTRLFKTWKFKENFSNIFVFTFSVVDDDPLQKQIPKPLKSFLNLCFSWMGPQYGQPFVSNHKSNSTFNIGNLIFHGDDK